MKRLVKAIASIVIATIVLFGSTVGTCAVEDGTLGKNVIPPEGRLFMPDKPATRATVAIALHNLSGNIGIQVTDTNINVSAQAAPREFSDISGDNPYYASVNYCASKGYVSGYPDGTFKPEEHITRAEICVIFARFLSLQADNKITLPTDIIAGHWASDSIAAIISNRIMSGYEDRTFRPGKKLTRAELATIIVNARQLAQPEHIIEFSDVPKTHWAYKYVLCVSVPDQPDPPLSDSAPPVSKPPVSAPSVSEPSPFETEVARLINEERARAGVSELWLDPYLCEIARIKAQDMIDNNYFGHKSPK
jgi:hypothetical protein